MNKKKFAVNISKGEISLIQVLLMMTWAKKLMTQPTIIIHQPPPADQLIIQKIIREMTMIHLQLLLHPTEILPPPLLLPTNLPVMAKKKNAVFATRLSRMLKNMAGKI